MSYPLLASCWTTAGDAAPQRGDERSPLPLRTRIEAAAAAGWSGFGLVHADIAAFREEHPLEDLAMILRDNGMRYVEVEFLGDWWMTGGRREVSDRIRADLLDAAETLGALTVKAAPAVDEPAPERDVFLGELDRLAVEAAQRGTRIALEPMPFATNIRTIDDGVSILTDLGHPGVGLCVDIWHVYRTGTPYSRVAELTADQVFVVELDDGAAEPVGSLWDDTLDRRRYPGRGDFGVPDFIDAILATGFDGPWGVEIISDEHRALPLAESLPVLAAETQACFPRSGHGEDADGRSGPRHAVVTEGER